MQARSVICSGMHACHFADPAGIYLPAIQLKSLDHIRQAADASICCPAFCVWSSGRWYMYLEFCSHCRIVPLHPAEESMCGKHCFCFNFTIFVLLLPVTHSKLRYEHYLDA